ncbi:hypothetical protein PV10_04360 [Exophiala mesophila]|uniref:Uncharacterized protein n=1 Tax=Exophiala mesophila TaxID=212818 RepID=A0A0D1XY24_EXOME|nr:uncharacterized protein PV10_04360 [Exophiala mesophila]KIV93121.1 hypothetical protein PV10_04360 [Exophiala mesophila]
MAPWQVDKGKWVQAITSGRVLGKQLSDINQSPSTELGTNFDAGRVDVVVTAPTNAPGQGESTNHEEPGGFDITDADLFEGAESSTDLPPVSVRRRSRRVRFGGAEYFQETANGFHYHFVPPTVRVPIVDVAVGNYHLNLLSRPVRVPGHAHEEGLAQDHRPPRRGPFLVFWFLIFCLQIGGWACLIRYLSR